MGASVMKFCCARSISPPHGDKEPRLSFTDSPLREQWTFPSEETLTPILVWVGWGSTWLQCRNTLHKMKRGGNEVH